MAETMEVERVWKKSKHKAEKINTVAGKRWLRFQISANH